MANALITTLGSSGDLNVDITKYRTFPVNLNMSLTTYTTVFTGISWNWARMYPNNYTGRFGVAYYDPPLIIMPGNTHIMITLRTDASATASVEREDLYFDLSTSTTSIQVKSSSSRNYYINLLIMVPES